MLAMASSSQNDRLQAKKQRNKVPPTIGASLVGGANVEPAPEERELFPIPAVRVVPKQDDELSNRIKGLFSPAPQFSHSPSQMLARPPADRHPQHPHANMSHHKTDAMNRPPDRAPPHVPADLEKKSRDSKRKTEGSEHKHKHKDKDKKRKSANSEERHAKKKAKTDRSHSPTTKESALPPPKSKSHRSSSVSSDRSDHSAKSKSSADKQSSSRRSSSQAADQSGHSSSKSSKSKHSSSHQPHTHHSSSGAVPTPSPSTHHPQSSVSHPSSQMNSTTHSTHGASNFSNKGAALSASKYPTTANGMTLSSTDNYQKNQSNSSKSNSSREKESGSGRPVNGLVRPGPKPTSLVIPSVQPSQTSAHKIDKDDLPIKKILAEMIKPTEKITEIQTPRKVGVIPQYPVPSLPKSITPISNHSSANKSRHSNNDITASGSTDTKDKPRRPSAGKTTSSKPTTKPVNGVADDLKLTPSQSGSDSGSSSDSNSSASSSSSSSSDSDSSDDEKKSPDTPSVPPMLFTGMKPSPVQPNSVSGESNSDLWNLDNYLKPSPATATATTTKPPSEAATALAQLKSSEAQVKKKRGRPRKEYQAKKNPDPDFAPPNGGKQPPPVITVKQDRKKRPSSSSSSKTKSDDPKQDKEKEKKRRGRPPKIREDTASSSNKSIISTTVMMSSTVPTNPIASLTSQSPPVPDLSSDADDEDDDVDVDAISDKSPGSANSHIGSSFQPLAKAGSPTTIKPEPLTIETLIPKLESIEPIKTEPKMEKILPKHEPISPPVDTKPSIFSHNSNDIKSLPISISLYNVLRKPRPHLDQRESPVAMNVPSLPVVKEEKLSPPTKRKLTSPSLILKSKERKAAGNVKTGGDMVIDKGEVSASRTMYSTGGGSKDIIRSTAIMTPTSLSMVPCYEHSKTFHEQARELKSQVTSMGSSPNIRPMRKLVALECVATFMMCGIAKEAEDPTAIHTIKQYYTSTLNLADSSPFNDCLKEREAGSPHRSIHRCCQVLFHYVIAHLKHKCYKLLKDHAHQSGRRVEEHMAKEKNKPWSISPHSQHTGLPSSASPAIPSPASITSTGSITSDSGRGASLPPSSNSSISVPESILKDVGEYIKCMSHMSGSVDSWKTAQVHKEQPECAEFFRQLEDDLGYSIGMFTESRPFVHYIHSGCLRLKNELEIAMSRHFS